MRPESRSSLTIFCVASIFIHLVGLAIWKNNSLANPALGSIKAPPEMEVTLEPLKDIEKVVPKPADKPKPEESLKVETITKETPSKPDIVKPKPEPAKPKEVKPAPQPDTVAANKPEPAPKPIPKPQPEKPKEPVTPKELTAPTVPDIAKQNDPAPRLDNVGRKSIDPIAKVTLAPVTPHTGVDKPDEQPENTTPTLGLSAGKTGVVGMAAPAGAATGGNVNPLAEPVDPKTISPDAFVGGGAQPTTIDAVRDKPTNAAVASNRTPTARPRDDANDQPDNTAAADIATAKVAPRAVTARTTPTTSLTSPDISPEQPTAFANKVSSAVPKVALNTYRTPTETNLKAIPRRIAAPRREVAETDQPTTNSERIVSAAISVSSAPAVRGSITRSKPETLASNTVPDVQPIAGLGGGTGAKTDLKALRSDTLASNGSIPSRAPSFHARSGGGAGAELPGFEGSGKETSVATVTARTGGGKAAVGATSLETYTAMEKPDPGIHSGSSTTIAPANLRYESGSVVQSGTRKKVSARARGGGDIPSEEPTSVDSGPLDTVGKATELARVGGKSGNGVSALAGAAPTDDVTGPGARGSISTGDLAPLQRGVNGRDAIAAKHKTGSRPTGTANELPEATISGESGEKVAVLVPRRGGRTARIDNNLSDTTPDAKPNTAPDVPVTAADLNDLRKNSTQVATNTPRKKTVRTTDSPDQPDATVSANTPVATVAPRTGAGKLNAPNLGGDELPDQRPNLGADTPGDPSLSNVVRETGRGIAAGSTAKKAVRARSGDDTLATDLPVADVNAPIRVASNARVGGGSVKSTKVALNNDDPTPDTKPDTPTSNSDATPLENLRQNSKTVAAKSTKVATKRTTTDQPDIPVIDDPSEGSKTSKASPRVGNAKVATGLSSTFFGIALPKTDPDAPINDVYLIDVSKSMADGNKIGKAKQTLKGQLATLKAKDHFNIICFAGTTRKWAISMRSATPENIDDAIAFLDAAQLSSNTDISDAIHTALSQKNVSRVILLSDGDPNGGVEDFKKLRALTKEWNTQGATMYAFALIIPGDDSGTSLLKGLAEDNNGKFYPVKL